MIKLQYVVFISLLLFVQNFADDEINIDLSGKIVFYVLENGQLDMEQNDAFLNGEEVDWSQFPPFIKPPIMVPATTKKPNSDPIPSKSPTATTTAHSVPTTGETHSSELTTKPEITNPPDPIPQPTETSTETPTSESTIIEIPENRESSDSEEMVVFVIIGSIVATIAVSGAIVGLLAYFKATPILAAVIAAD